MEITDTPNSITFNGLNSLDLGLYVSGDKTFNSPEKDYTKVSVPGRSGDLVIFNNRFKNVNVVYDGIVIDDYFSNTEKIREWLLSSNGYCRLEDTYHPDEYRLACFSGPLEFETMLLTAGTVSLTFDCKPQRFLKSAEDTSKYTYLSGIDSSQPIDEIVSNPTNNPSNPIIKITVWGIVWKPNTFYRRSVSYALLDVYEEWEPNEYYYYSEAANDYVLLTEEPANWDQSYHDYYFRSETYQLTDSVPNDWLDNWYSYFIRENDRYLPLSSDQLSDYTLHVGSGLITLRDVKVGDSYTIDCENKECYTSNYSGVEVDVVNLPQLKYNTEADLYKYANEKLLVTKWPMFIPNNNVLREADNNSLCCTVEINPRWWIL